MKREHKIGFFGRRKNSWSMSRFIISRPPTINSRNRTIPPWPITMVRTDSAVSNHVASLRLVPRTGANATVVQNPGIRGAPLQRPPPFEGPVLRAVLSKIIISRDLTKEALFLKGTIHVGGASHYSPLNPQAVSNLSRKS